MSANVVASTYWTLHLFFVVINLVLLHRALKLHQEWRFAVLAVGYAVTILSVLLAALAGIYFYGLVLAGLVILKAPLNTLGAMVVAAPFGLFLGFCVVHAAMRFYVYCIARLLRGALAAG